MHRRAPERRFWRSPGLGASRRRRGARDGARRSPQRSRTRTDLHGLRLCPLRLRLRGEAHRGTFGQLGQWSVTPRVVRAGRRKATRAGCGPTLVCERPSAGGERERPAYAVRMLPGQALENFLPKGGFACRRGGSCGVVGFRGWRVGKIARANGGCPTWRPDVAATGDARPPHAPVEHVGRAPSFVRTKAVRPLVVSSEGAARVRRRLEVAVPPFMSSRRDRRGWGV